MLKNQDIIVISDDWGRHSFSCQHLVERLLPFNRVLWVNTVGYRRIRISSYDIRRTLGKLQEWLGKKFITNNKFSYLNNLHIINPICLPFGEFKFIRKLNTYFVAKEVFNASISMKLKEPILLTTLPTASDFIGHLGEKKRIYYCVDDYALWPGENGILMRFLEDQLLQRVDLVIATSEKLQNTRSNGRSPTMLLTHGVDVEHFKSVGEVPAALHVTGIKRPTVGYYGLIDERCDLQLILKIARAIPHFSFLIIGPWKISNKSLSSINNIIVTGKVPYEKLPAYLANIDLLILPYYVNDLAESINPLKIKEYISTGLPVISTPLPEVVKLRPYVQIAKDADEFCKNILTLIGRGKQYSQELEIFLAQESWTAKADIFSKMISDCLSTSSH